MFFLDHIWIIPLLPLLGAAVMFCFGRGSRLRPAFAGAHEAHDVHDAAGLQAASGLQYVEASPNVTAFDPHAAHGPEDDQAPTAGHEPHAAEPYANPEAPHVFVNAICVGLIVIAFAWACMAVWQYTSFAHGTGQPFEKVLYTWLGTDEASTDLFSWAGPHDVQPYHEIPYAIAPNSPMAKEIKYAPFHADVGFLLDPLSAIWLLFVTGVGMLIHIYSTGYMSHEGGYYRFFGYLNLFMFSMLILILANNYALMFVGWEGVGLCSYLLIGFYFHRHSASAAANKAFIVNRVGDAGFILGLFTIAWYLGSVRFTEVNHALRVGGFHIGDPVLTAATLLLFVGACGKSAQVPLYIWLPDAMEGPTPVSALIHAATMVTAGVYMVARSNALFSLAPETMKLVAIVGAITAVFAASIGLVQNDIKRVLAYSTVSQLGYMFLALGVGAFAAGVFHVFTHAFFKALLFLGAGSVIHAMSGEQDMRNMGALKDKIPVTFWTMMIATLAIAGVPPLAGFFSKDEILWQAWTKDASAYKLLWIIGWLTAGMTAFYMFRLITLTFFGKPRMPADVAHHVHESPRSMTMPLVVLAFFALFAGFLGAPHSLGGSNRFEKFLAPVFERGESAEMRVEAPAQEEAQGQKSAAPVRKPVVPGQIEEEHTSGTEYLLMFLSVAAGGLGIFLGWRTYRDADRGYVEPLDRRVHPVYTTLLNKYYVDEAYDTVVTGRRPVAGTRLGVMGLGTAMWKFDANVIDGGVNGAGWLTRFSGTLSNWWDKWIIDGLLVNGPAIVTRMSSYPVRMLEWGQVQFYALVMMAGVLGFVAWYVWR